MKAVFQAIVFTTAALALIIGVTTSAARADDITPMYEGELTTNPCYDTGVGAHEKRTWIEEQDFLITGAEGKALKYIKLECHNLYHGHFTQSTTEFFDGHKTGRCEVSRDERRGCNALTCFGYSAGTCTTPGAHRQAETVEPKTATLPTVAVQTPSPAPVAQTTQTKVQ